MNQTKRSIAYPFYKMELGQREISEKTYRNVKRALRKWNNAGERRIIILPESIDGNVIIKRIK